MPDAALEPEMQTERRIQLNELFARDRADPVRQSLDRDSAYLLGLSLRVSVQPTGTGRQKSFR